MPKTNKICMYFDKEELKSISDWIASYFMMMEGYHRKEDSCVNSPNTTENCDCENCERVDKDTEILSRVMKHIDSRLSQK